MQEKLIIKNFGGIKDAEIEINEFNVFIGPQASGKSIVAKLLYYFKKLPAEISFAINKNIVNQKNLNKLLIEDFKKYFPPHSYPKYKFSIRYETKYKYFTIEFIKSQIKIDYSLTYYTALIETKEEISKKREMDSKFQPTNDDLFFEYTNKIADSNIEKSDHIFIPSGRSFFANIKNEIFTFLTKEISIDPLLLEFGRDYNRITKSIRTSFGESFFKNKLFKEIEMNLLKGSYFFEDETEYLLQKDKRKVELQYTSSGQQELLPLLSTLDYLMPRESMDGSESSGVYMGYTTYIEEPEAHIFPSSQKEIMELIVLTKNSALDYRIFSRQFIITTHSPYILTSLNNMMYAGYLDTKIKDPSKKDKLYKKLPKELMLNPNIVNAYSLEEGEVKSIIDKENHLIASDIIDKVSDNIAMEFDGLLDVEFEK